MYLPHYIKAQKTRQEREDQCEKGVMHSTTLALRDGKIGEGKVLAKNSSRARRVDNRRSVAENWARHGNTDDIRFNQLKKRKKLVSVARSAIHNWGLFASEDIPKDEMIIEYVGELVRPAVAKSRERRYLESGIGSSYLFKLDEDTIIDATKKGCAARRINHSCEANCTAKIITVDKSKRIVLYALGDIAKG
jgi:histone-lysine N-methyltransferase SETD1